MKKEYHIFEHGEADKLYSKLPKKEQAEIERYTQYRQARGITSINPIKDLRRQVIMLRYIFDKPIDNLKLDDLRAYLALLTTTDKIKTHTKNDIKINIKNFLKWKFKDWSDRFSNLEDIRLNSNVRNEEKINSKTILKTEDVEKFVKTETRMFWKAFFITQYEAGLRTKETRLLKWADIKFNVDGDISEIEIFATKTKKARPTYVKDATFYLKSLKEQQERKDDLGVFVFHSKTNLNNPVNRSTISRWMIELSKRVGKPCWNYLLRHSRATEVYRLAKQGKISKDIAINFMGHSEDMSHLYTHLDESEIKDMLKNQIYKLEELPPKEREELAKKIEVLEKSEKKNATFLRKFKEFCVSNPEAVRKMANKNKIKFMELFAE